MNSSSECVGTSNYLVRPRASASWRRVRWGRAWPVSSCSAAEAAFLLPFSLPGGDGLEAEKAGRIASLPEPGGRQQEKRREIEVLFQRMDGSVSVSKGGGSPLGWAGPARRGSMVGIGLNRFLWALRSKM